MRMGKGEAIQQGFCCFLDHQLKQIKQTQLGKSPYERIYAKIYNISLKYKNYTLNILQTLPEHARNGFMILIEDFFLR